MGTSNFLSIKRVGLLFKRTIQTRSRIFGMALIAYIGILTLFMFFNALDKEAYDWGAIQMSCNSFLIIFGLLFTSSIFSEMHKTTTGFSYITLPATQFEKVFVNWLITSPLFLITFSILSYLMIYIGNLICQSAFNFTFKTPEIREMLDFGFIYLSIQAIYFYGATFFKKYAFIKTTFFAALFALTLVILSACVGYYWVSELNHRFKLSLDIRFAFTEYTKLIVWIVIPLLFLFASYFSIKEKEV